MNLPRKTFLVSFQFTGWIIVALETIYGTTLTQSKMKALRNLPQGTVGREVVDNLDARGYRLIPKFENHDLKHLVLDYEMNMHDEIRMQAYLMGNGNRTFPCLIFFCLGIFYPSIWNELIDHYRSGKRSAGIHYLTLESCASESLEMIRAQYKRQ